MKPEAVLILTHRRDGFVVELVQRGLARRGVRSVRFDTDGFPGDLQLSTALGRGADRVTLGSGAEALDVRDVRAVWARKVWPPRLPEDLDPTLAEGCRREIRAALAGWLDGLRACRWLDAPDAVARAENKALQLRLALRAGLRVPRTLMTNDPGEVRAFADSAGPLVTKMLTPLSTSMDGRGPFVHTSVVTDEDLAALEGLRLCPMVFQEHVPKRVELRAVCVGDGIFVGALDASATSGGKTDWRGARPGEAAWKPWNLPDEIASGLRSVLHALGLRYAAADLIVTPEDEYVFLEVNPRGEWGMLEHELDLPIGDAIAAELLLETPENKSCVP